jgi:hypothetical protein
LTSGEKLILKLYVILGEGTIQCNKLDNIFPSTFIRLKYVKAAKILAGYFSSI